MAPEPAARGTAPLRWTAFGDGAITISFAAEEPSADCLPRGFSEESRDAADRVARRVLAAVARLDADPPPGVVDVAPAFTTVSIFFDPRRRSCAEVAAAAAERLATLGEVATPTPRAVEIPVAYGGELGPDLAETAALAGLSAEEVVRRHAAAEYRVAFIGFVPGFPYLRGLPAELAVPRLAAPRTRVPAGSVGIGGGQTGVYPLESPGGWRIIGRTPLRLFAAERSPAALLAAGDRVRFRAVSPAEFARIDGGEP
jgi:inhibitor of KinA